MKCPVCGVWTLIKDTRKQDDNSKVRRYECGNEHTFKTVEFVTKIISKTINAEQNIDRRKVISRVG
jgi:transcriptional regulator NrdR family protein